MKRALLLPFLLLATFLAGWSHPQATMHPMHVLFNHIGQTPGAFQEQPGPCSAYWGQLPATGTPAFHGKALAYAPCGYTGLQLQKAYGVEALIQSGNDGSGETIAIVDAFDSPTALSDANTYFAAHGIPQFTPGRGIPSIDPSSFDNSSGGADSWAIEQSLDIEAAHSIAPRRQDRLCRGRERYQ